MYADFGRVGASGGFFERCLFFGLQMTTLNYNAQRASKAPLAAGKEHTWLDQSRLVYDSVFGVLPQIGRVA